MQYTMVYKDNMYKFLFLHGGGCWIDWNGRQDQKQKTEKGTKYFNWNHYVFVKIISSIFRKKLPRSLSSNKQFLYDIKGINLQIGSSEHFELRANLKEWWLPGPSPLVHFLAYPSSSTTRISNLIPSKQVPVNLDWPNFSNT